LRVQRRGGEEGNVSGWVLIPQWEGGDGRWGYLLSVK